MTSIDSTASYCYLHIPKTAGTYIQHILNNYYGFTGYNFLRRYDFDEIYLRPDFFKYNNQSISNHNNQNLFSTNPYSTKKYGIQTYFSTSPLLLKMMNLNEIMFEKMFKFTFVRNPYERFISGWSHIKKNKTFNNLIDDKLEDIEYMILNRQILSDISYNHVFLTQYQHILDKNNINNMDFIGKIENLEDDLEIILNKIGIANIVHNKKYINKGSYKFYKDYYTQSILDFVNEFFNDDFVNFGYTKFNNLREFLI